MINSCYDELMVVKRKRKISRANFDFGHFSKRVKPGLKLGGFWLLALLGLFLAYEFWNGWKHSIWDGGDHFSIAYESNGQVGYINIDQELKEVTVLNFPNDLMMPLSSGYGEYPVAKIKKLAEQEKIKFGELLDESVTQYLGVSVDAYIVSAGLKDLDMNWLLVKSVFKLAKTNLSSWDLIRFLMFTRNLRSEQVKIIPIQEIGVLLEEQLPDNTQVYRTDMGLLDNWVLLHFADPGFLADDNTWEIYNGTFHDGFGGQVKRLVANSGFDVVGIRQSNEQFDTSMLEIQEKDMNRNIQKFADDFGFRIAFHSDSSRRSSVRLVIGEDYWRQCCTRRL